MKISIGDKLPDATFQSMGPEGPVSHNIKDLTTGKKIVIFGLPGAYTNTCSTAHMPSFVRNANEIRANGIDAIYCLAVNDVHVMKSWAKEMGADTAHIGMLSDVDGSYTKSIGFNFTVPAVGFFDRSQRYSMIVNNGVITSLNEEVERTSCDISGGETILDQL